MTRSAGARISRTDQAKLYAEQLGEEALDRQKRAAATRCKSCNKPIRWSVTGNGKRMPVDYDENDGGNVFLFPNGSCRVGRQEEQTPSGATRHYSHFATCPHASKHRTTTGRGGA